MTKKRRRGAYSFWLETLQRQRSIRRRRVRRQPPASDGTAIVRPETSVVGNHHVSARQDLSRSDDNIQGSPTTDTVNRTSSPSETSGIPDPQDSCRFDSNIHDTPPANNLRLTVNAANLSPIIHLTANAEILEARTNDYSGNNLIRSHPEISESSPSREEVLASQHPELDETLENDSERSDGPDENRKDDFEIQPFQPDEATISLMQTPFNPAVQDLRTGFNTEPVTVRNTEGMISPNPDIEMLEQALQIWESRLNLNAVVSVVGSVRYTVRQYEYMRGILQDAGAVHKLPPYARTQRIFKHVIDCCMPKSRLVPLPKKASAPINSYADGSDSEQDNTDRNYNSVRGSAAAQPVETEDVRVFLPSSWAKLDFATSVVFNQMFPSFPDPAQSPEGIEASAIVQRRASVTNCCDQIFANSSGNQKPCGPGAQVYISVRNDIPSFHNLFDIRASGDKYVLNARIVATWSVAAGQSSSPSFNRALLIQALTPSQKLIISSLRTGSAPNRDAIDLRSPIPGDVCTLLSSEHGESSEFPILVHRFWRHQDGIPSVTLLWLRFSCPISDDSRIEESVLQTLATHVVEDVSTTLNDNDRPINRSPAQGIERLRNERCHGFLADGTPFVIYRILIFCDDFRKSSSMCSKGSAGGCYFLPMSIPPEGRRSTSSVRIISLTPPGVSTNEVIYFITEDLVTSSVHGVDGRTPAGQKVRIFVDLVGFVADYPASSSLVDVVGHVSRAPCTLCSFRRPKDSEAEGSKFGFTTEVHAANSTFLRHGERHLSLRGCHISDTDAARLGMVIQEKFSDRTCPLLYIQNRMESMRSSPASAEIGEQVLAGHFDAFRCNFVAPDHLLTGLAKDILNATLRSLPSKELRTLADRHICAALRENGLLPQKEVFNGKKKMLNSMTLSEVFCVLGVSAPTMRVVARQCPTEHIIHECVMLLQKLQRLVALTYWWPQGNLDGKNAVKLVHKDKEEYFSGLKMLSKQYVEAVDEICGKSNDIKQQLDKPNLHRLIELYEHTIPALGHVREIMELVFESAHQPLKRCIARSNNHNAHIFAVEHCAGNDWQGRLAALLKYISDPDELTSRSARRGIRRLLLGEQADLLDEVRHKDVISRIDRVLEDLFTPGLRSQFEKDHMASNFSTEKKSAWYARGKHNIEHISSFEIVDEHTVAKIISMSKRWIEAACPIVHEEDDVESETEIKLFKTARRVRVNDSGQQIATASGYDTISINCCVQTYLDPSKANWRLLPSGGNSSQTKPFFFAVFAVLQRKGEHPWAVVFKCVKRGEYLRRGAQLSDGTFQLLQLTPDVRRVALYHICDSVSGTESRSICRIDGRRETHTSSLLGGGRFYFQCRVHGYPPRNA